MTAAQKKSDLPEQQLWYNLCIHLHGCFCTEPSPFLRQPPPLPHHCIYITMRPHPYPSVFVWSFLLLLHPGPTGPLRLTPAVSIFSLPCSPPLLSVPLSLWTLPLSDPPGPPPHCPFFLPQVLPPLDSSLSLWGLLECWAWGLTHMLNSPSFSLKLNDSPIPSTYTLLCQSPPQLMAHRPYRHLPPGAQDRSPERYWGSSPPSVSSHIAADSSRSARGQAAGQALTTANSVFSCTNPTLQARWDHQLIPVLPVLSGF